MGLYLSDKKGVLYKDRYKPVNLYHGNKKVTGWKFGEQTGKALDWADTYDDKVLSATIHGDSYQYKLPDVGDGAYTHTRYCLRDDGVGMTDKPTLLRSNRRNYLLDSRTPFNITGTNIQNQVVFFKKFSTTPLNTFASEGDTITFSADMKITGSGFAGEFLFQTSTGYWGRFDDNDRFTPITKEETLHFKGSLLLPALAMLDTVIGVALRLDNVPETVNIEVTNAKVEFGDTATSWTPAPEDYPYYYQPYIGIAKTDSATAPTDPSAYTWTQYMQNPDMPLTPINVGDNGINIKMSGRDASEVEYSRNVVLRSLQDGTQDLYDAVSGTVTRRIRRLVLDGTEDWLSTEWYPSIELPSYANQRLVLSNGDGGDGYSPLLICSHYPVVSGSDAFEGNVPFCVGLGASKTLRFRGTGFNNVNTWKAFLAAQYAAGTPVIVCYKRTNVAVEQVTPMALLTYPKETQLECNEDVTAIARVVDREL